MPRRPNVDDPVAAIRALLRELRASVETYHQARAKAGVKVGASESAR